MTNNKLSLTYAKPINEIFTRLLPITAHQSNQKFSIANTLSVTARQHVVQHNNLHNAQLHS